MTVPFPALDPEPPPVPTSTRLARAGALLTAVAAVAAVVVAAPHLGSRRRAAAASAVTAAAGPPAGRVVVVDGGAVGTEPPDGGPVTVLAAGTGVDPGSVDLAAAPDSRTGVLGTGAGTAPAVRGGAGSAGATGLLLDLVTPGPVAPAAPADLLAGAALVPQPWADRGRSLLLQHGATLSLVRAGTAVPLGGEAGAAAADPTVPGAAVAVGGRPLASQYPYRPAATASRVELRRAGAAPRTLVGAAQLAARLGLPTAPLVVDLLAFSPDGSRLLVSAWAAARRADPGAGLLVLDRSGAVVGRLRGQPHAQFAWLRWAPDGRSVALGVDTTTVTEGDPDQAVALWPLAGPLRPVGLPGALRGAAGAPCVWAPDSTRLRCGDERGWYDVDAVTATARALAGTTGRPLAWLP